MLDFETIKLVLLILGVPAVLIILKELLFPKKRKRRAATKSTTAKKRTTAKNTSTNNKQISNECRSDVIILKTPVHELNWKEFEHLWVLYFSDKGFQVENPGIQAQKTQGDGGVDLIRINKKTGERTATQCKQYGSKNIGVNDIRNLHSARQNHNCITTLFITTSNLTAAAKEEANSRNMELWNGLIVEQKLKQWRKYQGF